MAGPIHDKIKRALGTTDSLYQRLVLLVADELLDYLNTRKGQGLKSCFALTEPSLAVSPICPA